MKVFYNPETRVYKCYFTRDEYNALTRLATVGICSYHGVESLVNIEELRTLRDDLLEGEVRS